MLVEEHNALKMSKGDIEVYQYDRSTGRTNVKVNDLPVPEHCEYFSSRLPLQIYVAHL